MTININNDDLKNILSSIIKSEPNKDSLVRLLHDAIVENSLACEWLVKMKLGAEYPDIPIIGFQVVKIQQMPLICQQAVM